MRAPESVMLDFGPVSGKAPQPARDLSGAALQGDTLFIAGDEAGTIEIMRPGAESWTQVDRVRIGDLVPLPDPDGRDENDIESLSVHDGFLWITGSHSNVRKRADGTSPKQDIRDLARIRARPNRFVLARLPLEEGKDGTFRPRRSSGDRHAAAVEAGKRSSALMRWLAEDPMLKPWLDLPSKENGLDIEGIAVNGAHVWLGLRGPVLGGYAVVLQFNMRANRRNVLKARKLEGTRRHRTFLLPLGGLGVRDLCVHGQDLLVLTGPTGHAKGAAMVWRWHAPGALTASCAVDPAELSRCIDLTDPAMQEAPEALALWGRNQLLVLHDSPCEGRLSDNGRRYRADLVPLGAGGR